VPLTIPMLTLNRDKTGITKSS